MVSMNDAFTETTNAPAASEYNEGKKGKIESDYQADFILLDRHPLEVKKEDLAHLTVLET